MRLEPTENRPEDPPGMPDRVTRDAYRIFDAVVEVVARAGCYDDASVALAARWLRAEAGDKRGDMDAAALRMIAGILERVSAGGPV